MIRSLASAALLLSIVVGSASAMSPETRFERDGFLIDIGNSGGNCDGCEWLVVRGRIPKDAGRLVVDWMKKQKYEGIGLVAHLESEDGDLEGAFELGRTFRRLGLGTEVGRTDPEPDDPEHERQAPGSCLGPCAIAFLGGVGRDASAGSYGFRQPGPGALADEAGRKALAAAGMKPEQAMSDAVVSYLVEMGIDPRLSVEASRTEGLFRPTQAQMREWKVVFKPADYTAWQIEAFKDGIVLFARTQDQKGQINLTCNRAGGELMVVHKGMTKPAVDDFATAVGQMESFAVFGREIPVKATRLARTDTSLTLRVPLTKADFDTMQTVSPQYGGGLAPGPSEGRAIAGVFRENFPMEGLGRHVRLLRRNCT